MSENTNNNQVKKTFIKNSGARESPCSSQKNFWIEK